MCLTNEECIYILCQYKNFKLAYEFYATNNDIADDISCMLMDYEIGQDYYDAKKSIEICLDSIKRGLDYIATFNPEYKLLLEKRYCNSQSVLSISHSLCFKSEASIYANTQKAKMYFSRGLNILLQQNFVLSKVASKEFDVRKLAKYPKIIKALVDYYGYENYGIKCITKKQLPNKSEYDKHINSMMTVLLGTGALMMKNMYIQLIENTDICEGEDMNSVEYMILDIIDNYRVLPKKSIYEMASSVIKDRMKFNSIINKLVRSKRIYIHVDNDDVTCYSRNFNPHNDNIVYDNEAKIINKCFLVLARLTQLYKVRYHKLSHYPSTIKLIIEDESSEEHMFEIIYLPYSENAELVKRMGFFFEREYDEKYNVKRFAICENKWMIYNEASKIMEYIPNICSFVFMPYDSSKSALFYNPEELVEQESCKDNE